MRIAQLVPGAGNTFYCENCLRDNGLIKGLRAAGHDVQLVPLYLPMLTDETTAPTEAPVFFGGINVYLQQKVSLFRKTPRWIDRFFDSPKLLQWAAGQAGMTRASDLAETTLSMLRGEEGYQAKELERLVGWLRSQGAPDVILLSNALLAGLARPIKQQLGVPVVCTLQDEDIWVDELPPDYRDRVWGTLAERAADVDLFIAVSTYYQARMRERLQLPSSRVTVVYNGISLDGYGDPAPSVHPPVIGYLERQCPEKGLHLLIDAFIRLKRQPLFRELRLQVAGGKTGDDEAYVDELCHQLRSAGLEREVVFLPNPTRQEKIAFLHGLSLMSVPAVHREAFGMYVIESLAAGIPVVQPDHGAFPELLEATGGGVLVPPDDPQALADAIAELLADPKRTRTLGHRGQKAVLATFSIERMTEEYVRIFEKVTRRAFDV